jgi:hypothetical protein
MFLLQSLKTVIVCKSYIWLWDFMFYNTYILIFKPFMCKVLGLEFYITK